MRFRQEGDLQFVKSNGASNRHADPLDEPFLECLGGDESGEKERQREGEHQSD